MWTMKTLLWALVLFLGAHAMGWTEGTAEMDTYFQVHYYGDITTLKVVDVATGTDITREQIFPFIKHFIHFNISQGSLMVAMRTHEGNCAVYSEMACILLGNIGVDSKMVTLYHASWTDPTLGHEIIQVNGVMEDPQIADAPLQQGWTYKMWGIEDLHQYERRVYGNL